MKTIKCISLIIFSCLMLDATVLLADTTCVKSSHLFFMERNKNKNLVYYDVCLDKNNELTASDPVSAYWLLTNGKKENLSLTEKELAYGIKSLEKVGKQGARFVLSALKETPIVVEKIKGRFRASVVVNKKAIIIDKIYVDSTEQKITGLPKVNYVDVIGKTKKGNKPVRERIVQ